MLPKQTAKLLEIATEALAKRKIVSLCFEEAGWVVASSIEHMPSYEDLLVVGLRDTDGVLAVSASRLIAVKATPLP